MKQINPEGSLFVGDSADRDGEIAVEIRTYKGLMQKDVVTAYIGRREASIIIAHLENVYNLGE